MSSSLEETRSVALSGKLSFPSITNSVSNTKYTFYNFLIKFLFIQFSQPMNFFFLIISLSQTYPPFQVGFLFTYIAPLIFVLVITMGKEIYDDLQRYKRDKEVNSQTCTRLTLGGPENMPSSELKVGHILKIHRGERVPADMVLLRTSDNSGTVFIKTDQLDGETDWKLRKSLSVTQPLSDEEILRLDGSLKLGRPLKDIYKFEAAFEYGEGQQSGLELDNTLWANTTLASESCIGIVIYTGRETRSQMNSREPSNKLGKTDLELNQLSIYLVTMMLFIAFILLGLNSYTENWPITVIRYVLLLTNIIPISIRVNLDLAKMYYCYCISVDDEIGRPQPRNRTLPEELGRIHYLLTDKTGTLTKNEMKLKVAALENATFKTDESGQLEEMKSLIMQNLEISEFPVHDQPKKRKKRENHFAFRDFVTALALCNNVTPIQDSSTGETIFQASSPDEMALVEFAQLVGVKLFKRDLKKITIRTDKGRDSYKILETFPFSSSTKRMGIVLYHKKTDRILFYLKGADEVIKDKIDNKNSQTKMSEECENYAAEGLRTLVITQRVMDKEEYAEFHQRYQKAAASMSNREDSIKEAISLIERGMTFLGVTGVEDKLQDDVDKVIAKLNSGGIKVWMLTGDKVETAKCISISTGLKKRDQKFYELVGLDDRRSLLERLNFNPKDTVLIIDGLTLEFIFSQKLECEFVRVACPCEGVICSRVSPTQKSLIVKSLQMFTEARVAAIGDGGNDVAMIQTSHVGIGVEGKEGKQASLASDFAISEFKHLTLLVLWHGRLSYLRTSKLANFIFHRGMIISVIQILFIVLFYYSAIPIYNGYLMFGYSTIFTSLPVFALVLDEDLSREVVKTYPLLYISNQLGRGLNSTRFFLWLFKSIYQGATIILLSIVLFPHDNFVNVVAITFSSLIFTELLNIYSQIQRWKLLMVLAELFSLCAYFVSILWLKNYFDLKFIVTTDFFWKVLIITAVAWLPLHLVKSIKEMVWPPKSKQIQEGIS